VCAADDDAKATRTKTQQGGDADLTSQGDIGGHDAQGDLVRHIYGRAPTRRVGMVCAEWTARSGGVATGLKERLLLKMWTHLVAEEMELSSYRREEIEMACGAATRSWLGTTPAPAARVDVLGWVASRLSRSLGLVGKENCFFSFFISYFFICIYNI
jgi:hypothetical protein